MTPEVFQAWFTSLLTAGNEEIPEQLRTQLRRELIDLLIAIANAAAPPTPQARRR